jgi:CRISPR-associated protein Csd2
MTLSSKIDFAVVLKVTNANPNGDPLNGNRPRMDFSGRGEITDVCIKRKIRNRLMESKHSIFVQSDDSKVDDAMSLRDRAESDVHGLGKGAFKADPKDPDKSAKTARAACEKWLDVRSFGQLFAFAAVKAKDGDKEEKSAKGKGAAGVSIAIRGPVTIQSAFSIEPVSVTSTQITKSVSGEGDGSKRGSDTMGMKHRVDSGVYVFFGSMNPQLAERTGFSDSDAEAIKAVLPKLFENDASSARPEGSMAVEKVVWWKHNSRAGQLSSAKVHGSLTVNADGSIDLVDLPGLSPEVLSGF